MKKLIILAGNFNEVPKTISIQINKRYLNMTLAPHSLSTAIAVK